MQQHIRSLFGGLFLALISLGAVAADGVYDLEMVIFQQPPDDDDEQFPEEVEGPDLSRAPITIGEAPDQASAVAAGIELLPRREGRLVPAVYTLNRKGASVLLHLRWRQQLPESGQTRWYRIRGDRLDGLIGLRRGRYLHLYTDLLVRIADRDYRVEEHARARSGQLYYLDHPRIGILFRADRYRSPEEQSEIAPANQAPAPQPSEPEQDNPPEQRAPAGELPRAMPDNS